MKLRPSEPGMGANQESFPVFLSVEYHHQVLFHKIPSIGKDMKKNFI